MAVSISANPSFLALTGPVTVTSIGGVTAWRVGVLGGAMVGLMALLTVIRRTRADEESGRSELLASGVLGRNSLLTGGLLLAWATAVVIGLICALGAIGGGQPVAGSFALGAALVGPGLVFASVGGHHRADLRKHPHRNGCGWRYARCGVRRSGPSATSGRAAVVDLAESARLAGEDRRPTAPTDGRCCCSRSSSALALTGVAVVLSRHRDLGLGYFPARLGPAHNPRLGSGLALAVRLHRASWIGWAIGFLILGMLTGSLAGTADEPAQRQPTTPAPDGRSGRQGHPGRRTTSRRWAGSARWWPRRTRCQRRCGFVVRRSRAGRCGAGRHPCPEPDGWPAHLLFSLGWFGLLLVIAGIAAGPGARRRHRRPRGWIARRPRDDGGADPRRPGDRRPHRGADRLGTPAGRRPDG